MTPEFCLSIPKDKAKMLLSHYIDYNRNPKIDNEIINIVKQNYE